MCEIREQIGKELTSNAISEVYGQGEIDNEVALIARIHSIVESLLLRLYLLNLELEIPCLLRNEFIITMFLLALLDHCNVSTRSITIWKLLA